MPLLEVENISVNFFGVNALDDVSLSVEAGEFVGLMGPNGAGKTSILNCISRVIHPQQGKIVFDGIDLLKLDGHEVPRTGVSRTFQNLTFFNSNADMSILEYMCLGQLPSHPGQFLRDVFHSTTSKNERLLLKQRARRILEFFADIREEFEPNQESRGYPALYGREGFPDLLDVEGKPIQILSFAWRRRLDLARALVSNPRLLLLDEPAQGLPPSEIENLGILLKAIQREFKISALIVEHNIATLSKVSQKIVAMGSGKVIAQGPPDTVKKHPEVIASYLGSDSRQASNKKKSPSRDEKPILEISNLDVFYGQAQALYSVSIKLFPKEISCILGTNGSGKSTLLKAIVGIEVPRLGEINLKGEYLPLGKPETAAERGMQYVPQGHILFPRLTVEENLRAGTLLLSKMKLKPDFERIYHYFPQLKDAKGMAANLSGGQQQMLAIAQAIIAKPQVLLLDEPSLGLAPKYVELLFSIIEQIAIEEKCSILIVEQSVAISLDIANYIYMMSAGFIVGSGPTENFKSDPALIKKYLGFY